MSPKDIFIAVFAGVVTGLTGALIFKRLAELQFLGQAIWLLVVITPLVFVSGLYLGRWLSRWRPFFNSFARFAVVGFLNTAVDIGVFNLLMFLTGIEKGQAIALFKASGAVLAFLNGYFWNKYWSFEAGRTQNRGAEFIKYISVTVGGAVLNVGITALIVNFVPPAFDLSQLSWNNLAAVIATVFNLAWNFSGYRWIVFKRSSPNPLSG